MQCCKCGKEAFLPFRCPHCRGYFCSEHRLPENHECPRINQARAPVHMKSTVTVQSRDAYKDFIKRFFAGSPKKQRIRFSAREIQHLTIASLLVVGIALSLLIVPRFGGQIDLINFTALAAALVISFFAHEMAHKVIAQRHGFWAEFRLTFTGAALTLFSIVSPYFKVMSPGAIIVSGLGDGEGLGKMSIAGPITNIILSMIFLTAKHLVAYNALVQIFLFAALLNAYAALVNLIPLGMLDGFKVLQWNKKLWILTFAASMILSGCCYMLVF